MIHQKQEQIKEMLESGFNTREIARKLNVGTNSIVKIRKSQSKVDITITQEELTQLFEAINEIRDFIKSDPYAKAQKMFDELPEHITSGQVKKIISVSSVTLWHWEKNKILIPTMINGRKYFKKAEVLDLCKKRVKTY